MRFNEKQLIQLSKESPDFEDRLDFKRISTTQSSHKGFKNRWFRLKFNMLFYFKFNESGQIDLSQPAGVFILEGSKVECETLSTAPFAFSLSFHGESDKKYLFSTKTEESVQKWLSALRAARYEDLRAQLTSLQTAIELRTGKDPLQALNYYKARSVSHPNSSSSSEGTFCRTAHGKFYLESSAPRSSQPPQNNNAMRNLIQF